MGLESERGKSVCLGNPDSQGDGGRCIFAWWPLGLDIGVPGFCLWIVKIAGFLPTRERPHCSSCPYPQDASAWSKAPPSLVSRLQDQVSHPLLAEVSPDCLLGLLSCEHLRLPFELGLGASPGPLRCCFCYQLEYKSVAIYQKTHQATQGCTAERPGFANGDAGSSSGLVSTQPGPKTARCNPTGR